VKISASYVIEILVVISLCLLEENIELSLKVVELYVNRLTMNT
jgi:hypothetical protein